MKHFYFYLTFFVAISFMMTLPARTLGASGFKSPGNNRVLVYAPGYSKGQNGIAADGIDYFRHAKHFNTSLPIDVLEDTAASVEAVESFSNYGTVIIETHGWFWKDELPKSERIPIFRSGSNVPYPYWYYDVSDTNPDDPYWYLDNRKAMDLYYGRLAVSKKADENSTFQYVVFPSFIKRYVHKLNNTLFYLGYCHSLQNDKMWDVLASKGAKVAFGWSDTVKIDTNRNFFDNLMDRMLPNSNDIEPQTAQKALSDIPDEEGTTYDNDDYYNVYGRIVFKTSSDEWNNFIYDELNDFLVISLFDNSGHTRYIVWDVKNNSLAKITDTSGTIIQQPCNYDVLSYWLITTKSVGKFNASNNSLHDNVTNYFDFCTIDKYGNTYYYNNLNPNCGYDNPEFNKQSFTLDDSGQYYPLDTCTYQIIDLMSGEEVIKEININAYPGTSTPSLFASSDLPPIFKRKLQYVCDYHDYNIVNNYFATEYDINESWNLQIITPIGQGEPINVKFHVHAARPNAANWTVDKYSGQIPSGSKLFYDANYSDITFAQIYAYFYRIDDISGPPYTLTNRQQVFKVFAQSEMVENENPPVPPISINRNTLFENAITNLMNDFANKYSIKGNGSYNLGIKIDIRRGATQ